MTFDREEGSGLLAVGIVGRGAAKLLKVVE